VRNPRGTFNRFSGFLVAPRQSLPLDEQFHFLRKTPVPPDPHASPIKPLKRLDHLAAAASTQLKC
jgi:hypothetical protein